MVKHLIQTTMCNKKKILILPSWYATPEAPTSGSFFKEQAELMLPEYDVKVLVASKRWISQRRFFFEKHFKKYNRLVSPYFVNTPPTYHFEYDFIKAFSEERNLDIEIQNYCDIMSGYFISQLEWNPDLIHAQSSLQAGIVAMYMSKRMKIPYCITEHMGPFNLNIYNKFWAQKIVDSLEKADAVMAVSNHQKQHILMNEINCNPISVGNLVNENFFSIMPNTSKKFTAIWVTYYPNFIKDADTFFKAVALLKGSVNFIVVGGGELKGECENNIYHKMAKDYGVTDSVEIVPKATRQEMNDLYARSHILVSTSIAESFGVAICEAMLCGRPVVTTANGGCNDYMIEDFNGYVVPLKDPDVLAKKILCIKENYAKFNASDIRKHIVDNYGNDVFRNRISAIYKSLIG